MHELQALTFVALQYVWYILYVGTAACMGAGPESKKGRKAVTFPTRRREHLPGDRAVPGKEVVGVLREPAEIKICDQQVNTCDGNTPDSNATYTCLWSSFSPTRGRRRRRW